MIQSLEKISQFLIPPSSPHSHVNLIHLTAWVVLPRWCFNVSHAIPPPASPLPVSTRWRPDPHAPREEVRGVVPWEGGEKKRGLELQPRLLRESSPCLIEYHSRHQPEQLQCPVGDQTQAPLPAVPSPVGNARRVLACERQVEFGREMCDGGQGSKAEF